MSVNDINQRFYLNSKRSASHMAERDAKNSVSKNIYSSIICH